MIMIGRQVHLSHMGQVDYQVGCHLRSGCYIRVGHVRPKTAVSALLQVDNNNLKNTDPELFGSDLFVVCPW